MRPTLRSATRLPRWRSRRPSGNPCGRLAFIGRPAFSVRSGAFGLSSLICLSNIAPAPTTRPPTTPTVAAAPVLTPWPFSASTCGKAVGGVRVLTAASACSGLRNADCLLGAAEAGMPGADRPGAEADVAETDRRAVRVSLRTLAADLVEAEALPVPFVAELKGEAPGIEMRPPLAVLVDQTVHRRISAGCVDRARAAG